jgi:hypothetical protein
MAIVDERRRYRRLPIMASLHCRRLGRGGFDEEVRSVDLSAGGALLRTDRRLGVGDVLLLDVTIDDVSVGLKGLVIATREVAGHADERFVHIVHIAFTGLSDERITALARLLDGWERDAAAESSL